MGRCVYCSKSTVNDASISYHRFPKDPLVLKEWMLFTDIRAAEHVKPRYTLCSLHFTADCFDDYTSTGGRRILKKGAIPTIKKPSKLLVKNVSESQEKSMFNMEEDFPIQTVKIEQHAGTESMFQEKAVPEDFLIKTMKIDEHTITETIVFQEKTEVSTQMSFSSAEKLTEENFEPIELSASTEDQSFICAASERDNFSNIHYFGDIETLDMAVKTWSSENNATVEDAEVTALTENQPFTCLTPEKVSFSNLRYIGDIRTPDIATPRRARKTLAFAQNEIKKARRKIKCLQESNRRLRKKVETMQQLMNQMKDKNLSKAEDSLMVTSGNNKRNRWKKFKCKRNL